MNNSPILLIEDNPDDIELTRIGFLHANISNEIVVMSDGHAAIEFCNRVDRQTSLSMIVLDLNLPRVSGFDVLRGIRKNAATQFVPVIVMTTSDDERDVAASYAAGANAYVRKPIAFDEFQKAAGHIGLFWLNLNITPG